MSTSGRLRTMLRAARTAAGLSQEALATAAGISRQAYAAIESGAAVPSTEVALRLARALGTSVERLFALPDEPPEIEATLVAGRGLPPAGGRVRLLPVGGRVLAEPLAGVVRALPGADGWARPAEAAGRRVRVALLGEMPRAEQVLVMRGCDPATGLLAAALRARGVELIWSEEGSRAALAALGRGEAHVAGCHLRDEASGHFNAPWVRRLVPFPCTLVSFAIWQQGLIVAPGNPLGLREAADLARPGVRIVNRAPGTGARALLDRVLAAAGVPPTAVRGYEHEVDGHLAVAEAIRAGLADAGVGVRAAAEAAGLDFVLLAEERYDLVVPNHFLDLPAVGALLDVLQRPGLRRQVEALGGYDIAPMGHPAPSDITPSPP
jgi:putative molybdopterin biosynthesis protein